MPRQGVRGMRSFFEPKSVAVAGVSTAPDKMGSIIFANLVANRRKGHLKASVYALNPAHNFVGDQRSYPSIESLPETPELLIIAVPEPQTVGLMEAAAKSGVRAAIIVTSGYAEVGKGEVEKRIAELAAKSGMRVVGPNTIGVVDTRSGVDSLFLRQTKTLPDGSQIESLLRPLPGEIAVITQSGHLGQTIIEELAANGVGIRALVGTGNQVDVSVEDAIEYFAEDPHTKVISVYLEGLRDGRKFLQAAYHASKRKPVVVFKVGKTGAGARAALTHTASLVGDHDVYRAAFREAGLVEAGELQELMDYSVALLMLPRPAGRRVAIITNAGGVGAIAADEAERCGLQVEPLRVRLARKLRTEFRDASFISNAALGNPIDTTASATTEEFARMTKSVLSLAEYDAAVVLPTHQTPAVGYDIATRLTDAVASARKPVVMSVIGNSDFAGRIHSEFMARGIPSFPTPERAVRALAAVADYATLSRQARPLVIISKTKRRGFGRTSRPLPPREVSRLLQGYGIREPESFVVHSGKDLSGLKKVSFPVACKLLAKGLLHKKDVGGVAVDVGSLEEVEAVMSRFKGIARRRGMRFDGMLVQEMVRGGTEMILGGTRDSTFGPVVIFGLGGTYTELFHDHSLAVAPLTAKEAMSMLAASKLGQVLGGYRGGRRADLQELSEVISRFSRIMVENPSVEQVEINPLIVSGRDILAVDARGEASKP